MKEKRNIKTLYVYINGDNIGALHKRSSGDLEFKYNSEWMQNSEAYPISLSLPFSVRSHKGGW